MFWKNAEHISLITPDEMARLMAEGRAPVLLEVRSAKDYQKGHLPNAVHIPLDELERRAGELNPVLTTVFY
jgi:rhodanese-related sulfurtransferase